MIIEIALLHIKKQQSNLFEEAFAETQLIISSMPGYIKHELLKCMQAGDKYMLIVHWRKLEDHTEGFKKSERYNEWKGLLHHFYEPFPVVEHYSKIY